MRRQAIALLFVLPLGGGLAAALLFQNCDGPASVADRGIRGPVAWHAPAPSAAPELMRSAAATSEPEVATGESLPATAPALAEAVIHGRLIGPGGPVFGARIAIDPPGSAGAAIESRSDRDGAFRATLPALGGQVRVRVEHPDHVSFVAVRTLLYPTDGDLGIVALHAGAVIRGRVVGADGIGAGAIEVRALDAAGTPLSTVPATRTDATGAFELRSLPAGEVMVEARPASAPVRRSVAVQAVAGAVTQAVLIALGEAGMIHGQVVDPRGAPIAGARVDLLSPYAAAIELGDDLRDLAAPRAAPSVRTDEQGRFSLAAAADVPHVLHASALGYLSAEAAQARAAGPPVHLVLEPLDGFCGRVLDRLSGAPIAEFVVAVQDRSGNALDAVIEYGPAAAATPTLLSESGTFILRNPPTDRFHLRIEADGYAPAWLGPFDATTRTRGWPRFLLNRGAAIVGRVVDPAGRPVDGASVSIVAAPDATDELVRLRAFQRLQDAGSRQTRSDADGRFEFGSVLAGRYLLTAAAGEHGRAQPTPITVDPAVTADPLELVVEPPGCIEGTVFSAMQPHAEATVCLLRDGEVSATTTSNPAGRYAFAAVEPGPYALAVSRHGSQSLSFSGDPAVKQAIAQVSVASGATVRLDLVTPACAELVGVVHAAGSPLADALVTIAPLDVPAAMFGRRDTRTDPTGAFQVGDLSAGRYAIVVRAADDGMPTRREITLSAGARQQVTFEIGTLELAGQVVDEASGAPLAGVTVRCFAGEDPSSPLLDPATLAVLYTQSGADGSFTLRGLQPGAWQVAAQGAGFVAEPAVTVQVPGPKSILLRAQRAAELTVLCVDRNSGAAVGPIRAELIDERGARYLSISDTKGEMYFPAIGVGRFTLRCIEPDIHGACELVVNTPVAQAVLPLDAGP